MGRYFANGVAVRFEVMKRNNGYDFDVLAHKDEILKELNNYVNIDDYIVEEYNNCFEVRIKKDIFNDHIHELIKEISPLTECESFFLCNLFNYDEDINLDLNNFDKEKYNFELCERKDENNNFEEYYIGGDGYNEISENYTFYSDSRWLLYKNDDLYSNINIQICIITLWMNIDKVSIEDDNLILEIINTIKKNYYKTPLGKDLIYYITE